MQTQHYYTQDHEKEAFISFIIPVYNVPVELLRDCIRSILALSLRSYEREIIVVDDGSETSPLSELGTLIDDIIYVRQKNAGVAQARNTGLKMASGQFVQFIDADDRLIIAPYEHVLDLIRYEHADMVMYDFNDKPTASHKYKDTGPMSGSELMKNQNIHGSACVYIFKRSMLGTLRFTPGIAYGEDEEFTPQLLLRAEKVMVTSAKAYYYRLRPTSAINSKDLRSRMKRLSDAREVIFSLHKKADILPRQERLAMNRRVAQLTMDYIYNVIILIQSRHYLNRKLEELRRKGLFPLPDQNYTSKYKWFRRMTNSRIGLMMLMRILPLMKKER